MLVPQPHLINLRQPINSGSWQARGLVFWVPFAANQSPSLITNATTLNKNTITGSPTIGQDGAIGHYLSVNGGSDYVYWTANSQYSPTSAITTSVWFRTTQTGDNHAYFSRWGGSNSWLMRQDSATPTMFFFVNTSGGSAAAYGSYTANDGLWHHAVGTYNGANSRLYIDGVLAFTSSNVAGTIVDSGDWLSLGRESSSFAAAFIGDLADPRIYNYAMNASEVAQLYYPKTRWDLYREPFPRAVAQFTAPATGTFRAAWSRNANRLVQPSIA